MPRSSGPRSSVCAPGSQLAFDVGDHGTRELLEHILVGEESHLDWIETQQRVIAEIGEAHYLAQQLHD